MQLTVYVTSFETYGGALMGALAAQWGNKVPLMTCVQVAGLYLPGMGVEIDAEALAPAAEEA